MLTFKTEPLKIDHSKKVVFMTPDQVDANKYQISKGGTTGFLTKDGSYSIHVCFCHGGYYIPVYLLFDVLWQCLRALEVMYRTHMNDDEYKSIIARVYRIHQSLIPYGAGLQMPAGVDFTEMMADSEGLTLLKEIIGMTDEERNKLIEHDRVEGLKTYSNSPQVSIKGETITTNELANYIRYGCKFMAFDADTTSRHPMRKTELYKGIIPALLMSYLLRGEDVADAIDSTFDDLSGINKSIVEVYANNMKM